MIGISLPYTWLLGDEQLPKPEVLLPQLWEKGVRSIELRMIPAGEKPENVRRAADILWDYGFKITIHATAKTAENAVAEVLAPLSAVIAHKRQSNFIVTIHPIVGDNAAMLIALSNHIISQGYPVKIALENERKLPDKTEGNGLALTLKAVTKADRDNIGICFDMGHFAWYADHFTEDSNTLPPKEFLSKVIHTHIHAYEEGTTHYPLVEWKEPLASYVKALDYGYFGVYNIELSPQRFAHKWEPVEAYLLSAEILRKNFPFCASLYEDLRLHYDDRFRRTLEVFKPQTGSYVSLMGSSAYLFNTNGYHWAMDLCYRNSRFLAETPARAKEDLGQLKLVILTHAHDDHMEESTIRTLADTEITWLLPEFMVDMVAEMGVRREKMIVVKVGDVQKVGPLTIRVLPGRHYRPENHVGLEAVGYVITAEDMPKLAFPGDIRDYRTDTVEELDADYCFAHVWLTDNALDPEKYVPKSKEFAKFMLKMSRRNILLAHLYENAREERVMWQRHHARVAADEIQKCSPKTVVRIPSCGEVLPLV